MPKLIQNEVQQTRTVDHREQRPKTCAHTRITKTRDTTNPDAQVCTCNDCGHSWHER